MKHFASFLVLGCWLHLTTVAQARTVTFVINNRPDAGPVTLTNTLTVGSNEVATLKATGPGSQPIGTVITVEVKGVRFPGYSRPEHFPFPVVGPAVITVGSIYPVMPVENSPQAQGYFTFEIAPESFPPDKTLIIPEGTGATVYMETSTNLTLWTSEWSQTYTNSPSHRFFRLRAERIP